MSNIDNLKLFILGEMNDYKSVYDVVIDDEVFNKIKTIDNEATLINIKIWLRNQEYKMRKNNKSNKIIIQDSYRLYPDVQSVLVFKNRMEYSTLKII